MNHKKKTIDLIKVEQCTKHGGKAIENLFIIYTPEGKYLQSYGSIIAFVPISTFIDKILIKEIAWNAKNKADMLALQVFLDEGPKETQKKINYKEYLLVKNI